MCWPQLRFQIPQSCAAIASLAAVAQWLKQSSNVRGFGGLGPTSECVKPSLDKMPWPKLPSIHPAHITHGLSQLSVGEDRIRPAKSLVHHRATVSITYFDIHFNLSQ